MELPHDLAQMDAQELRDLTAALFAKLQLRESELTERDEILSRARRGNSSTSS